MIALCLKKLTQFEITGVISKFFIPQGKLKIKIHFRNEKSITFLATFTLLLVDSVVFPNFNKGNDVNLKKKSKFQPQKNQI